MTVSVINPYISFPGGDTPYIWTDLSLRTGMIAGYNFRNDALDVTGQGNDGTISGATTATGIIGDGLDFDGTNDYVDTNINPSSLIGSGDFSVSGWFNSDSFSGFQGIVDFGDATAGFQDQLSLRIANTNELRVDYRIGASGGGSTTTTIGLSTSTWYHFVMTRTGTNLQLYINNALELDVTNSDVAVSGFDSLYIGAMTNSSSPEYFNGKIDEVYFYNRVLTSAEVSRLYASGSAIAYGPDYTENISAYYNFDADAYDFSGNGNTGTITGATLATGKINSGFDFDGINDYITIGNAPTANTINFWVYLNTNVGVGQPSTRVNFGMMQGTQDNGGILLGEVTGGVTNEAFYLVQSSGTGTAQYWTFADLGIGTNYYESGWHFFSLKWDGSKYQLSHDNSTYADRRIRGSASDTRYPVSNMDIGRYGTNYSDFVIDEVVIYDRALSASEVSSLYNSGTGQAALEETWTRGIVAYYPFDSDATDFSGNSNYATVNGATNTTGKINNGYDFDGTNDSITLPSALEISGSNTRSFAVWAYIDSLASDETLFEYGTNGAARDKFRVGVASTGAVFIDTSGSGNVRRTVTSVVSAATWHHIVIVVPQGAGVNDINIYVNATEPSIDIAGSASAINTSTGGTFYLGRDGFIVQYLGGDLDEFIGYNRELSSEERTYFYNSGSGRSLLPA